MRRVFRRYQREDLLVVHDAEAKTAASLQSSTRVHSKSMQTGDCWVYPGVCWVHPLLRINMMHSKATIVPSLKARPPEFALIVWSSSDPGRIHDNARSGPITWLVRPFGVWEDPTPWAHYLLGARSLGPTPKGDPTVTGS